MNEQEKRIEQMLDRINAIKAKIPEPEEIEPITVPYIVFEGEMARSERHIKRLWIAVIALAVLLAGTNIAWIIYNASFDTVSYSQDGEGINNVNIGEQGDLNNGTESDNSQTEKRQEQKDTGTQTEVDDENG